MSTNVLSDALANYETEVTSMPFETLVRVARGPSIDLGRLVFPAGSATINDTTAAKPGALKSTLEQWQQTLPSASLSSSSQATLSCTISAIFLSLVVM